MELHRYSYFKKKEAFCAIVLIGNMLSTHIQINLPKSICEREKGRWGVVDEHTFALWARNSIFNVVNVQQMCITLPHSFITIQ